MASERLKKQAQGLQWSLPGPLHINYGYKLGGLGGLPILGVHVSLTLLPVYGNLLANRFPSPT